MNSLYSKYSLTIFIFLLFFLSLKAQQQISPKYSVDAPVNAMITKGDTLIVAGDFFNAGIYTGGGAFFTDTSAKPNLNFPKIIGEIYCSTPDGNGGVYIYGDYRRESESVFSASKRIEHINADYSFESGFSLPVTSLYKLNTILYNNGILYIGGDNVTQINSQPAGNLTAVNVTNGQVLNWLPVVSGVVTRLAVSLNTLYVLGNFTSVAGISRTGAAAVQINTGSVRPWNPSLGGPYNDLQFYNNKVILGGGFSNGTNHACAVIDTITGQTTPQYIFSTNLYSAASVKRLALKGDTLFAFSNGTFDTRLSAINLAASNTILWNKYFNLIADASSILIADTSVYIGGFGFDAVYKTNLTNTNITDTERTIKGMVAIGRRYGDLKNWFPNPTGLTAHDIYTVSAQGHTVFAGGNFSHVNSIQRSGILMMNTVTDEILPFDLKIDYNSKEVKALKLLGNTLYVAGDFNIVNSANYAASVFSCDIISGAILPWHPVKLGSAWALEGNGQYIFVGGNLTEPAGGSGRINLFAINRQSAALAAWNPNPNNFISTNSLHISKGRLYAGGNFTNIAGQARNNIASFDTTNLSITNWQPSVGSINAISSSDTSIWIAHSGELFSGINPLTGVITDHPMVGQSNVVGGANALLLKGRYVIAGGNFKINGGICNNMIMFDALSKHLVSSSNFCEVFNNNSEPVNTMSTAGNDIFIGGTFTKLNGKMNAVYIERLRFPAGYFDTVANNSYSFYPQQGGNGGDVTVNFYGGAIQPGMHLSLRLAGQADIVVPDSLIVFPNPYEMKARINLRQKPVGIYDVILTSQSGTPYITLQGFSIIPFAKSTIWTQITGPDLVRTGRPNAFAIQVGNRGNCDAAGIPVMMFISASVKVTFFNQIIGFTGTLHDTAMYVIFPAFRGTANRMKGYWLLLPNIPAQSTTNYMISVEPAVNNAPVDIYVDAFEDIYNSPLSFPSYDVIPPGPYTPSSPPLPYNPNTGSNYHSPIPFPKQGCIKEILEQAAGMMAALAGPPTECFNHSRVVLEAGYDYFFKHEVFDNTRIADVGSETVGAVTNCVATFVPEERIAASVFSGAYNALEKANELAEPITGTASLLDECFGDPNKTQKNSQSRNSIDPNDKRGVGNGNKHFITCKEPLEYGIVFENSSAAGLPAQTVIIKDTLDVSKLDTTSFRLNFFNLSGKYFYFSPGQKSNTTFVDLRPAKNLILKVNAALNGANGVFTATFISLDPITMQPTTNPLLGFLSPDINVPEGEAGIYFTISAKESIPDETIISNKAYIYFDNNPVIPTPVWNNTIDKIPPHSMVNDLPSTISDTSFTVSWTGTDGVSGIEAYNIYYAINEGAYKPLLLNTNRISVSFTGKPDSTYSFYSTAVDSAGNLEIKTPYDAKTTISKQDFTVYPNPNKGYFTLEVNNGSKIRTLELYDAQGRKIEIGYTQATNIFHIQVKQLLSFGIYYLEIKTDNSNKGLKIILLK